MMSVNRLFEIVYLLLERKQMTASELAEHFEVSVRTIYRDIDALSSAGVPVFTTQGKGGGVALMDHFVLNRAAFTEEEQRQLLTALQSLPEHARLGSSDTLIKLSGLFRRQETDWLQVNLSRWGNGNADSQKFERLKAAILERHIIVFQYVSSYGQTSDRHVLPARLVFKGQAWYLQGWCLAKEAYRTFKVSRILQLTVTDKGFNQHLSPPPIEAENPPGPFCVLLKLRFSPVMAYRVYDEFDESCVVREASGTLVVKVLFPDDGWLYGYLLSFGAGVDVLDPPHVRQKLCLLAKEIWISHMKPDRGCQVSSCIMESSQQQEVSYMDLTNQKFCQSCGMPLSSDEIYGTEANGGLSDLYCKYCYENGIFTANMTMEEMIDFCVPMMVESTPGLTTEAAREQMMEFFPMLQRWKQA